MMYIMSPRRRQPIRRWSVAQARAKLPEVLSSAAREPQAVYRRDEPVAVVISPRAFAELDAQRRAREAETLGDVFARLRAIAGARRIVVSRRRDRANAFDRIRR
jgi:PHD/YefM family antitoxin component YafN of YafNO toxin-antitoxin module